FAFFYRYYNHFVLIKCYWLKNLTIKLSGKITHTFFIYKTFCQKNHNLGQASFILGSYREFVAIVSLSINRAIGFRFLRPKGIILSGFRQLPSMEEASNQAEKSQVLQAAV
ncbi:hypothetical protein, partial [uncultured Bacteroides sp.]